MAEFPALPLFTDAYLGDTRHLTAAQHGAYLLLLMTAWRSADCSLPDNDIMLAKWAAMNMRTWLHNKDVVMAFWKKDAQQKWYQPRLIDERKHAADVRNKNVLAGKASALKKKGRHLTSVITDVQLEVQPPIPIPIPTQEKTPISPFEASISFEDFWRLFPEQTGRGFAFPAYQKALTITTHEVIMAALRKQLPALKLQKFPTANPTKWLQGECWADTARNPGDYDIDEACRRAIL